jgi:hypothetical protein
MIEIYEHRRVKGVLAFKVGDSLYHYDTQTPIPRPINESLFEPVDFAPSKLGGLMAWFHDRGKIRLVKIESSWREENLDQDKFMAEVSLIGAGGHKYIVELETLELVYFLLKEHDLYTNIKFEIDDLIMAVYKEVRATLVLSPEFYAYCYGWAKYDDMTVEEYFGNNFKVKMDYNLDSCYVIKRQWEV